MQALIDFILDRLADFWPFVVVDFWETALRVRLGKDKDVLAPGCHWRWPFLDNVISEPAAEQTINLPAISVETADHYAITASGNIAYRITGIREYWRTLHDGADSLANILLSGLSRTCCENDFETLHANWDELHDEVREQLQREVAANGITITRVGITDLVQARQYRLFVDQATFDFD